MPRGPRPRAWWWWCLSLAVLAPACRPAAAPPSAPPTLDELAAAWSGGSSAATCSDRGPRGEYLGPAPGAEHCRWPVVARGADHGSVSGQRDAIAGLALLTWERTLPDSGAATALADSLSAAFAARGLDAHPCPDGGRRWQRPGLGVQLSPLPPGDGGRPRVVVMATIMPAALPDLLCPGVPALPGPDAPALPPARAA